MPSSLLGLTGLEHVTDARLVAIAFAALAVCLSWFAVAGWRHRRNLRAVRVRIHVAGTRGKSTTTRLIAAGLRAGGLRVIAKSTGSLPRLILPDGSEQAWPRRGPASIREQARFFARAVAAKADAAVVECMAIRPELVWASESQLVQATTAVITNARADHFEEIGAAPGAAGESLRWVTPQGGRLVVAREAADAGLLAWAAARATVVDVVDTADLPPEAANRALALAVCAAHGIPESVASPAMAAATPDPGASFERALSIAGKPVRFFNAFACNDAQSLAQLWHSVPAEGRAVVLFNARRDRPLRTRQFAAFLAGLRPAPVIFVTGDRLAVRAGRRAGLGAADIRWLRARAPEPALAEMAAAAAPGGLIWGIGNYHGFGARLIGALAGSDAAC